jgi:hypothetical protein
VPTPSLIEELTLLPASVVTSACSAAGAEALAALVAAERVAVADLDALALVLRVAVAVLGRLGVAVDERGGEMDAEALRVAVAAAEGEGTLPLGEALTLGAALADGLTAKSVPSSAPM